MRKIIRPNYFPKFRLIQTMSFGILLTSGVFAHADVTKNFDCEQYSQLQVRYSDDLQLAEHLRISGVNSDVDGEYSSIGEGLFLTKDGSQSPKPRIYQQN